MNNNQPSTSIDNVYRLFGEASHWASILEEQLCNICMLNERVINQERYKSKSPQDIVTMFERETIGSLITLLKKILDEKPDGNVDKIFKPALEKRNHLIHKFFIYHHNILNDGDLIPSAIAELTEIKNSIYQAADFATKIFTASLLNLQNINTKVIAIIDGNIPIGQFGHGEHGT